MKWFDKGVLVAAMVVAASLALPGAARAADCGAEVEKAKAEWEQLKIKGEAGELEHYGKGKVARSLDEVLRKAEEANKAGKRKRCANLIKKLRARWHEKGWK